ncbi:MAG: peptide chain release factor N(5)-glutamine methyltransferase [Treponema sp.]|jgi:release factor glutamine methyltransferase|nr:peptide chain release factor N(5)-glutamine methyltransferase [Treponema sp.]
MTIRETLLEGKALLSSSGVETPSLDAGLLLAEVLHTDRAGLIVRGPETLVEEDRNAFLGLIRRRGAGECAAYILGRKEFMGLDFTVTPDVLVPRGDTETLVEAALRKAGNSENLRVLDLCTGSGAVAVSLKHARPGWEIWGSDLSEKALRVAKLNAGKILGSSEAVRFIASDLFDAFDCSPAAPRFSLIVTNPPYVKRRGIAALAREIRMEPRIALDGGEDGLELIRRIIPQAARRLSKGGGLLIEADPRQMKAIALILKEHTFEQTEIYTDLAGRERVISALLRRRQE